MRKLVEDLAPRKDWLTARQRLAKELREHRKSLLKDELMEHIGRLNAIGMAELYEIIYGESWENRINDTRGIRSLVSELRNEGRPIASSSNTNGGGYYLPAAGSELNEYLKKEEHRAKKILDRNSRIKKVAMPDYLGQLSLEWSTEEAA